MSLQPFLVATGSCGLPRTISPLAVTGAENLGPITPATVARTYWLLRSLTITYSYAVDGWYNWSEEFTCTITDQPRQRLLQSPNFSRTVVDSTAGRMSSFSFCPAEVYQTTDGQYFFQFQLSDGSYPDQEILLTTELQTGYQLLASATASFLDLSLSFFLQTAPESSFSNGSISSIGIVTDFW